MSYLVLARKYRPKTFEEMVGQEHVLKSLVNALDNNRLHHAYLFTGTRGVGKTTVARIFAKCLNNESGISSQVDLQSQCSKDIDKGRFIDLIEVDAASRTKVEQTRELLENIHYPPVQGRFKVYLIDEVHMLSTNSFNALLKTFEEPPEFVKFLLATTDPQKLPITITSRCLQFNLKQISQDKMQDQLKLILDKEQIGYGTKAIKLLAKAGKGSLRDALSITDQAIAFCNSDLSDEAVMSFLGEVDSGHVEKIVRAIADRDAKLILNAIENVHEFHADFSRLVDQMLECFQAVAITQQVPDYRFGENQEVIQDLAKKLTPEIVQLYYQMLLRGKKELELAVNQKMSLEMIALRMIAFTPLKHPNQLQQQPSSMAPPTQEPAQQRAKNVDPEKEEVTNAQESVVNLVNDDWLDLYRKIDVQGFARQIMGYAQLIDHQDSNITFLLGEQQNKLLTREYKVNIKNALTKLLVNDELQIHFKVQEQTPQNSPIVLEKRQEQDKEQKIIDDLKQEPEINALMEQFDAKIVHTRAEITDTINVSKEDNQ